MEVIAESWEHFRKIIDDQNSNLRDNSRFLFRGQSFSDWRLTTSLARALPEGIDFKSALFIERAALDHFRSIAHLFLRDHLLSEPVALDPVGWWSLMQHYRAPTRIIDWTSSPYIAAYFAVQENHHLDGAVWCLDSKLFNKKDKDFYQEDLKLPLDNSLFLDENSPNRVILIGRRRLTDRMLAQQGVFMTSLNVLGEPQMAIEQILNQDKNGLLKIIVPSKNKLEYLGKLRRMNITGQSLFPGADGVGKSVLELIELAKCGVVGV